MNEINEQVPITTREMQEYNYRIYCQMMWENYCMLQNQMMSKYDREDTTDEGEYRPGPGGGHGGHGPGGNHGHGGGHGPGGNPGHGGGHGHKIWHGHGGYYGHKYYTDINYFYYLNSTYYPYYPYDPYYDYYYDTY